MKTYIAGHSFDDGPNGRRCTTHTNEGRLCHRSWLTIKDAGEDQIGKKDIAHNGNLNASEWQEINVERKREIADVWAAVVDSASAGTR